MIVPWHNSKWLNIQQPSFTVIPLGYHIIQLLGQRHFYVGKMLYQNTVMSLDCYFLLLLMLHCTAVSVHIILVYSPAVNAVILLQFYTMILLYLLEYFFVSLCPL